MELYQEVDRRRAERQARREERMRREARIQGVVRPMAAFAEYALLAILVYLCLFAIAIVDLI